MITIRAYFTYYNTSMLFLHQYNLNSLSLYELYILRDKYVLNHNFIVENMKSTIIETIDSIIREKKGGSELLDILKNNYKLREILTRDISENFYDNYTFLQLYNNINSMEKIFDFTKDSLLNDNQIKNRNYLVRKNIFDKIKEPFLSCQWNKFL